MTHFDIIIDLIFISEKYIIRNYLRKLHCRRNYSFYNKLIEAHSLVYNKSYDLIITDWLKAILKINIGDVRRTNTFWCSALVSYLYCKLGFVRKDIPWTIISPKDLGTENPKESLEFINCVVDKEIKLETLIKTNKTNETNETNKNKDLINKTT